MATIHTELPQDLPGHHGEYVVGQILSNFSNPGLELWFDINYIAGVNDLDLIVLDNQVGFFLIEIKSMKLDAIKEFTWSTFTLKPEQSRRHPVVQVRSGSISLREHLGKLSGFRTKGSVPFIQTTVLWSEITRRDWNSRFEGTEVSTFNQMCIFKDDLDTYNKFISALQRLWDKPMLGTAAPFSARCEHGNGDGFRQALKPDKHRINVPASMTEEFRRPIRESKGIADKYPPGKTHLVSIQGAPGTGKTTLLRELGLANLAAGGRVLYVCFNKVLAADQKREFQILRKTVEDYGLIDVFDVWELYKTLGHSGGINKENEIQANIDRYLASEEGRMRLKYDVILVDESQDLTADLFRVLEKVSSSRASWFVAYGKGQELHNLGPEGSIPTEWLSKFLAKATPEYRRRSFRNSPKAFLTAQSFWEKYPDSFQAKDWIAEKFKQQSPEDLQFELDLSVPQTKNDFKLEIIPRGNLSKVAIRLLLLATVEDAKQAMRGGDILVGVIKPPTVNQSEEEDGIVSSYEMVKEVLNEISQEFSIAFNDLVPSHNRREVPDMGAIRLVSLQSIRGLSASHVIIFDLVQLEKWAAKEGNGHKPPIVNLGYIALSRSKASTIVVLENSGESLIEPFLYEVLSRSTELSIRR